MRVSSFKRIVLEKNKELRNENFIFHSVFYAFFGPGTQYQNIQIQPKALKCSAQDRGTVLVYVNGQENRIDDVINASIRLEELLKLENLDLKKKLDSKGLVKVEFVFNPTLGTIGGTAIGDFIESGALLLQNRGVPQLTAWRNVYGAFMLGFAYKKIASIFNGTELVIDPESQEALKNGYRNLLVRETEVSEALKDKIFSQLLISKKKVIIISHSQGNLFANKFYQRALGKSVTDPISGKNLLFNDFTKYLGNAQVATPAEFIAIPKGNYITNFLDAINSVDWVGPISPLPANFNLAPPPFQDTYEDYDREDHHSFLKTYLYGEASGIDTVKDLTQQTIQNWVDVAAMLDSNCDEAFGCGGKLGRLINETAFVAETATLEEGASVSGNVEICDKSIIRSGAQISVLNGSAKISENSEVLPRTFISIQSGILNISSSTVEGSFIPRTGADPSKAIISITGSDVFGNIYCESIMFATGSCAVNISGSTITNAQAGVVARAPMKRAEINITGSTISGLVSSDALFSDSILNLFGVNVCSGSYYSAFNGSISTNINEVCGGAGPQVPQPQ